MNLTYIVAGAASIAVGAYVRRSPEGLWNRLAAGNVNMWASDDAGERLSRAASALGGLLIVVGFAAVVAGLVA